MGRKRLTKIYQILLVKIAILGGGEVGECVCKWFGSSCIRQ
jgi:hypothetical protein